MLKTTYCGRKYLALCLLWGLSCLSSLADDPCKDNPAIGEIRTWFSSCLLNFPTSTIEKILQEGYFEAKPIKLDDPSYKNVEVHFMLKNLSLFHRNFLINCNEEIKTIRLLNRNGLFYSIAGGAAGRLQCSYVLFRTIDGLESIQVGGITNVEDLDGDGIDEIIILKRPEFDFMRCGGYMAVMPYWHDIYHLDSDLGQLTNVSNRYPKYYESILPAYKKNYEDFWSHNKCKEEYEQLIKRVEFMAGLPLNEPEALSSFFGVQTHFAQHQIDVEGVLDLIKEANIFWVRDEVYWAEIEKSNGIYKFPPSYDGYIHSTRSRGIQVLLILDYGNPLYTHDEKCGPATDEEVQAFARYCSQVVGRYKPLGVRHYEIWNEPNISTFWLPQPNADNYVRLLKRAYEACKDADPDCVVLGCAASGIDTDFIGKVFSLGGGKFMDAVSIHPYSSPQEPEQHLLENLGELKNIVGEKPIWITETGYPTYVGKDGVDEQKQANYLVRTYLLARSFPTLARVSWYDFQNDGVDLADPESNFGLIYKNKELKPAYNACKTLISLTHDLPLVDAKNIGSAFIYKFETGKKWVIATWKIGEDESIDIPVSGSRFRIVERDGESRTVSSLAPFLKLTVSEKPRYIVSAE